MKPDKTEVYKILEKELCSFSTQGDILIGGDFNSRLGTKYEDFICYDSSCKEISRIKTTILMGNYYQNYV